MQFIGMFEERLGSYRCDIFARITVLAVGVGPCFYDFLMEKKLLWPTRYLMLALQNRILK